jgi:hypothetical protein
LVRSGQVRKGLVFEDLAYDWGEREKNPPTLTMRREEKRVEFDRYR